MEKFNLYTEASKMAEKENKTPAQVMREFHAFMSDFANQDEEECD
jgi:hypothetical protein